MIKFCISSHKNFYNSTYPVLIESLINAGIQGSSIYFFIGGVSEYKQLTTVDSINLYEVPHNSMDFTALISVVELGLETDYWFLLHDTTYVGSRFGKSIYSYSYENQETIALSFDLSMNMGAYSWNFLQQNLDKLISFKNTDYSIDGLQKTKQRAVQYEDCFLDRKHYYCTTPRRVEDSNNMYGTGTNRIVEIFDDIDLYKIKANWYNKPVYETKL